MTSKKNSSKPKAGSNNPQSNLTSGAEFPIQASTSPKNKPLPTHSFEEPLTYGSLAQDQEEEHSHGLSHRPRRLRRNASVRNQVREIRLHASDFIQPLFVVDGKKIRTPLSSLPGQYRLSIDSLLKEIEKSLKAGILGYALFPALNATLKDPLASESRNPRGLYPTAIKEIKRQFPETVLYTDVALDPYSSLGHDGLVIQGEVDNDQTIPLLCEMALIQAEAGSDFVAPSDMMDGRVGAIREYLDIYGFSNTGILSYCAKYASAFYGPFRDALDSAPVPGKGIPQDKKSYQMDPANRREALREAALDLEEGADILMVKPALPYLDIISDLNKAVEVPIAAYQVSGEYAQIKAAAQAGWLNEKNAFMESLTSIKRAGASLILSYYATEAAQLLNN